MRPLLWVVLVAAVLLLLGVYVSWTAGRLDRQHARVDAAWAALDAQLVRRAAAARALAAELPSLPDRQRLDGLAHEALEAGVVGREQVENDLTQAVRQLLPSAAEGPALDELALVSTRVGLARSFHNSAVKDSRALRGRRLPRALRLAGHRGLPRYFEIEDTMLAQGPADP